MEKVDERGSVNGRGGLTQDGTVDLKGRHVLRSRTGSWKSCSFIIAYEILERVAYHGIAASLVMYLTTKMRESHLEASKHVSNWSGTVWMTPIVGAYLADAYFGRFWTFFVATLIYMGGMIMVSLSVSLPALKPPVCGPEVNDGDCHVQPTKLQVTFFYTALYITAIASGGTKPNISSMGADQFDDFDPKEKVQKTSFFNWWMSSVFVGSLFASTVIVYLQDTKGFKVSYVVQTIALAIGIMIFIIGIPLYRHKKPLGSPFTILARVLVAAIRKWNVTVPDDPAELHELSFGEYARTGKFKIDNTPSLRFLDKASVKTGTTSPWMLCPVTQVEETKQMIKMIPIMVAAFMPSLVFANITTNFIQQGKYVQRQIGEHFRIPAPSLKALVQIAMLISCCIYDRIFVPIVRRYTKNPRGITLLQRMGIGIVVHIAVTLSACLAERKRLSVAKEHGIFGKNQMAPVSVLILFPQFILMGIADTFLEVAKLEFFYDQAPQGMKSLGTSYYTTSLGIGSFMCSFLLNIIKDFTRSNGQKNGWVEDNLNLSRLDKFYALLAVLSFLNLIYFLLVSKAYVYNADITQHKSQIALVATPSEISEEDEEDVRSRRV